jgi:hypothetical protein
MVTSIKDYYQRYWSEDISDWRPSANGTSKFEEQFFASCIVPGCQILDFGCGQRAFEFDYLRVHTSFLASRDRLH